MALWEYKIITSGVHGFATPALLEAHLNSLGKDEWEIINFQTQPNNPLAFHGLARRSTQRDWVPPEIAAAAAAHPVSKPVSIFDAAAPKPAPSSASAHPVAPAASEHDDEKPEPASLVHGVSGTAETAPQADKNSLRTFRDTDRDLDPDAEDEDEEDEWENFYDEEDLPTFFEALKPHFRNNQKGPGQSVGIDFLMKRWGLRESDLIGALKECGLTIPESEDTEPEYFEFDEDLYWVNKNNRGQLFINTREKPRPVFRTVQATKLSPEDPASAELAAEHAAEKTRIEKRNAERAEQQAAATARAEEAAKRKAERAAAAKAEKANAPAENGESAANGEGEAANAPVIFKPEHPPSPESLELLQKIRPHMRRNPRGHGYSGTVSFLARALKCSDADLVTTFTDLGMQAPDKPNEKPHLVEIESFLYWLNKDNRGNIWINSRENKNGSRKAAQQAAAATDTTKPAEAGDASSQSGAGTEAAPLANDTTAPQLGLPLTSAEAPAAVDNIDSAESPEQESPASPPVDTSGHPLSAVRLLLKPNKRGSGVSGEVGFLARTLDKGQTEFVAALTEAGLVVPPNADAKPTFVEHAGEIFWFSIFPKDGSVWLNAKPAKAAAKKGATRGPRSRKPKAEQSESEGEKVPVSE